MWHLRLAVSVLWMMQGLALNCPYGFERMAGVYGLDDTKTLFVPSVSKHMTYKRPRVPVINTTHCFLAGHHVLCNVTNRNGSIPESKHNVAYNEDYVEYCWPQCANGAARQTPSNRYAARPSGNCPLCYSDSVGNCSDTRYQEECLVSYNDDIGWDTPYGSSDSLGRKIFSYSPKNQGMFADIGVFSSCPKPLDECTPKVFNESWDCDRMDPDPCPEVNAQWYGCECPDHLQCNQVCDEGNYSVNGTCTECPKGFMCPGNNGKYECPRCPRQGMRRPQQCYGWSGSISGRIDAYYNATQKTCVVCPVGFYCPDTFNKLACDQDRCPKPGMSQPYHCTQGSYWNGTVCNACPVGFFCASDDKQRCPSGTMCQVPHLGAPIECNSTRFCAGGDAAPKPLQPSLESLRNAMGNRCAPLMLCGVGTFWNGTRCDVET